MSPEATNPRAELEARLRFETLLADLSSQFVNLPASEVDREIMEAQRRICELLDLDLLMLWQQSAEASGSFSATHFYSARQGPESPERLKDEDYPWFKQELVAGRIASFASLEELPAEAARDRESFRQLGTKSNLSLPLLVGGGPLIGAFCLNATRAERDWPDALVKRLQLIAQIFANAIARKRAEQALRESEERMALAAEAAEFGVWGWNVTRNQVWGSEQWRRLFGFASGEEVSFETVIQRIHPEDRERVEREVRRALANGDYAGEFRLALPDGTQRWIASRGRGHPDASGKPAQMLGAATDITERKRTEDALRTSEARLAAGADLAGLGCYEVDYVELSSFADERFGAICGVPAGYQKGIQRVEFWMEHIHPEDRPRVLEERQKLHEGKVERYDVEYRYLHPTQGQKWLHHVGRVATRNADGRWIRAFGVVRDITERKRLSEQLQSAAEEWQATFDSINDLVMILDAEYRILRVNAATVRFLGLPMEMIVGSLCYTLMHGTHCPIEGCPCQKTFQTRQSAKLELIHPGSGKWLLFSTDPIRDAAGNVIGVVHVGRDITEAKRAEAELLRQRTELAHIARVSTMGELAASVAHELNQPLGAILANAEAAELFLEQDPPALDELHAILAAIRKDDERAAEVIRRMRALLRKHELERQPLDLNALVQDVLQLIGGDAALRGISLATDLFPALPKISGDRVHLQQVLLNLILNGMDAMADQPRDRWRLSVRTRLGAHGQVELAVIDSGHGIEPDRLPRLFEPFYTSKPNGMGMGLSIARTIIEAHRGRIWAENNASGGAVFRITLPASDKADSASTAPPSND
jgi:PAS domain S-box-containing protein